MLIIFIPQLLTLRAGRALDFRFDDDDDDDVENNSSNPAQRFEI